MPQRAPSDGLIDWSRPSLDVYNFIRAQTRPYPGAFTFLGPDKVMVWEAKLFDARGEAPAAPGQVMRQVCEGPLQGVLVAAGEHDHPLLVTEASNAAGAPIDLTAAPYRLGGPA